MQAFINAISHSGKLSREGYHLKLGSLVTKLQDAPPEATVAFDFGGRPGEPHSYRGYYEDLSFEPEDSPELKVGAFLKICRDALGQTFEGYKGGDFVMDESTVLWASPYGSSGGRAIVGAEMQDGRFVLLTRDVDN